MRIQRARLAMNVRPECRTGNGENFFVRDSQLGSRALDANANRYRCITELSTVRCVRDKVSPLVVRFSGPEARGETGRARPIRNARVVPVVPNVE